MSVDRGILAALGAAVLFGASTPLAKILAEGTPPLLLSGLLYLGSGLGLALVMRLRRLTGRPAVIVRPRGAELGWLLTAIGLGGGVAPYLLMYGLRWTDSASASLILNLEGVLTALLAWFVFKENFDRRIAVGMGLIVAGGLVLSAGPALRASGIVGPLAIATACLAWAIDNNVTRKVSAYDAMSIACAKGLVAGGVSVALALGSGARLPSPAVCVQAAVLGLMGYGISLTLFVVALRRLGTARTGAYFSLAPFIGATLAVILGAPVTIALVVAALLMGVGVWLHLTEHHSHWHRHAPLRHEHSHVHDEHHRHSHGPEWKGDEPHTHVHDHELLEHEHAHFPDTHHRHGHN